MYPAIKNKKVLVTGGAGFIGSHIVDELLKPENNVSHVTVIDNLITGKEENISHHFDNPKFTFYKMDIRNKDICTLVTKDIDIICHQAALGSVPRSMNDPVTSFQHNINGNANLLQAARENNVPRFVYASSSSVYGTDHHTKKIEKYLGEPLSPYAISKLVNEQMARIYEKNYNIEAVGLRYFNIFGPRQDPNGPYAAVIPKFIQQMLKGKRCTINGDGNFTRDFTYVSNAVHANMLAMTTHKKTCFGNSFNVSCGGNTSINSLHDTIAQSLNLEIEPEYGPERPGDVPNSMAHLGVSKEHLQYIPEVTFKMGIEKTVEWFKDNEKYKSKK